MKSFDRQYSALDELCLSADKVLRAIFGKPETTHRKNPSQNEHETSLTPDERKHSAGLMRINHTGEVCAQALYHAQGLISKDPDIKLHMQHAAIEEGDHLDWCHKRLIELGSHRSYLNPFWYAGSFAIGLTAGFIGDKWNLGFVAETEHQVIEHLQNHLISISPQDKKSIKILEQMQKDEAAHRHQAIHAGAATLPSFIQKIMRFTSKIMVKTTYYL